MIGINTILFSLTISASIAVAAPDGIFGWSTITPSANLTYLPCFEKFQCARLLLPLDWLNENTTDTVSIAIIKLPAAVHQDDPTFGGAILTNPGGPGGSGIDYLLGRGSMLQSLIDIPGQKHYEYISFDPRGVGASRPRIDCYPANNLARLAKLLEWRASGAVSLSPASFAFQHYSAKAFAKRCEKTNAEVLPFVNSPSVARDMVAMVDKIAELRQGQAMQHNSTATQTLSHDANEDVPRLQYIGFSYGTVLGNYFASLFPERVGRMVLDGVVDSYDYSDGPDTDKMMEIFFEGCFNAGSEVCQLRQASDKTPSDISKRTWSWINARDAEPIQATSFDGSTDVLLRSAEIRGLIFMSLYSADYSFFPLASILAEALKGNTKPLIEMLLMGVSDLTNQCIISNNTMSTSQEMNDDAYKAVLCGDGSNVSDQDSNYWKRYMDRQVSISTLAGDVATMARLSCAGWRVRPNWSFKGPFKTPAPSKDPSAPEAGHPAAPLLFLSSRWDPVTPLRSAYTMASRHPGAGVLVENSMGHTLIGAGKVSECSKQVVSEYFDKGVVPKKEVLCEGVKSPWDGKPLGVIRRRTTYNLLGV
ncbi:hypothetical protein LLEC1_01183 [Akanthomyces lecanii]|uniref:Peptidase S33 tripeptidyl aminopeptidase-like C-terminal domain-containing protein n=1 Tax=Cordyceps confragosa TaxID=2714763 RepID=A0A179ID14_CORDF|nr:hypothetical protein LLEC1_01183 [Akanthomyces lecanii]